MMTTPRPPCPHCGKRLAYDAAINDGHTCRHCSGDITWSVPFGSFSSGGRFHETRDKRPRWNVREDHCRYCNTSYPFGTVTRGICDTCREGKAKRLVERRGL